MFEFLPGDGNPLSRVPLSRVALRPSSVGGSVGVASGAPPPPQAASASAASRLQAVFIGVSPFPLTVPSSSSASEERGGDALRGEGRALGVRGVRGGDGGQLLDRLERGDVGETTYPAARQACASPSPMPLPSPVTPTVRPSSRSIPAPRAYAA